MIRTPPLSLFCMALALCGCTEKPTPSATATPSTPHASEQAPSTATTLPQDSNGASGEARKPLAAALTEREKIDLLIKSLAESNAVFIRNGKEYSGAEAAGHLRTKLGYAGNRIKTANDFVEHLASKSSESGKPYQIKTPDGAIVESRTWLLERLVVIEDGAQATTPSH